MIATPRTIRIKRNISRGGGCNYESVGWFDCSLIVLIRFMAVDVVTSEVGVMPGDARQEAQLQREKMNVQNGFSLIVFG